MNDQNNSPKDNSSSYVDNYQPPAGDLNAPIGDIHIPGQINKADSNQETPQKLEQQNIFYMLGVEKSSDEEKESFLDELQQVIWEDFLESDVKLLITDDEYNQLEQIMSKSDTSEEDRQEEMVVFLEKLIPDLEEIMLEKAIELKADMFRERIMGLKEFFQDEPENLEVVQKAEDKMKENLWHDAAATLNALK